MKAFSFLLIGTLFFYQSEWGTDFEQAKLKATQEHKCILLNFSGSDWCGPCIKLAKDVFGKEDFINMASTNLVLVNADFPRQKKNQLPKDLQKQNNTLADKYNEDGIFPLTVLLTSDGKLVRKWEGYPNNAKTFINQIKTAAGGSK